MKKREHRRRARPPRPIARADPRGRAGRWRPCRRPRRNARRLMAFFRAPSGDNRKPSSLPVSWSTIGERCPSGRASQGPPWVRNASLLTSSMIICFTEPCRRHAGSTVSAVSSGMSLRDDVALQAVARELLRVAGVRLRRRREDLHQLRGVVPRTRGPVGERVDAARVDRQAAVLGVRATGPCRRSSRRRSRAG